jgi:Ca2+/Na+ antiporter
VVGTMLLSLRVKFRLTRANGIVLFFLYIVYLYFNYRFFFMS